MDKSQYKDVCVFVEQREGIIQKVALELLGKARELADTLNEKVIALLLGTPCRLVRFAFLSVFPHFSCWEFSRPVSAS